MIGETLLFFGQYGIYFVIIISLLNFRNEAKSLIAIALALAISFGISSIFYVPRPFVKGNFTPLIPHSDSSSFPSRHAAGGFAMSASTFSTNTILGTLSAAVSILMVLGRIYAGLHSKTDIIAGVIIGGLCAIFAYSDFVDRILKKIFRKSENKIKYHRKKKASH